MKDFFTFWAPTSFTPDGDNINDIFICKGVGIDNSTFNLQIYDRWGEIIFETSNLEQGWDGKDIKSKRVKSGVYTWLVKYEDLGGVDHQESGTVTVIY